MITIPSIPPWEQLHPAVIHFPIALLLTAPLFIVIGSLVSPQRSRPYMIAALLLMVMGTAGVWFAVATGEATADLIVRSPNTAATLDHHEKMAESVRTAFTGGTLLFIAIVVTPIVLRSQPKRILTSVVPLVFVAGYVLAALLLVNTAHEGGRLVHELGSSPAGMAQSVPGGSAHEE